MYFLTAHCYVNGEAKGQPYCSTRPRNQLIRLDNDNITEVVIEPIYNKFYYENSKNKIYIASIKNLYN